MSICVKYTIIEFIIQWTKPNLNLLWKLILKMVVGWIRFLRSNVIMFLFLIFILDLFFFIVKLITLHVVFDFKKQTTYTSYKLVLIFTWEREKKRLPPQEGQIPPNETRHQGKLQDKQESQACQPSIYAQLHLYQQDQEELIELLMPKLPLEWSIKTE